MKRPKLPRHVIERNEPRSAEKLRRDASVWQGTLKVGRRTAVDLAESGVTGCAPRPPAPSVTQLPFVSEVQVSSRSHIVGGCNFM
jgi:hypothetical protein